jgi:acyl carrier protein
MKEKVFHVVSQVLGVQINELSEDSSPETIQTWDSLKHMNLVLALEEEFGVRFSDEKIIQMLSIGLITEAVQELLP